MSDREFRLECLRVAASLCADPKDAEAHARAFFSFVRGVTGESDGSPSPR
jgi:hypothetical protein